MQDQDTAPLTSFQAHMRRGLLVAIERSRSGIDTAAPGTSDHVFWSRVQELELDELAAFDRREGAWWHIARCLPGDGE